MAIPETPLDKIKVESALQVISTLPLTLAKFENAMKAGATATLAAAVIQSAGRPVSVQEAMDIQRDIYFATFSGELAGHGVYKEWAKTKDARLAKPFA
jgi:hypothetical protein